MHLITVKGQTRDLPAVSLSPLTSWATTPLFSGKGWKSRGGERNHRNPKRTLLVMWPTCSLKYNDTSHGFNSLKKILGWTDRLTKSERALQNGNEEYEEWVWSGQMCSNVFWPVFCMDKSISTHTLSHTHAHRHKSVSQYICLCFFMWHCGGGQFLSLYSTKVYLCHSLHAVTVM